MIKTKRYNDPAEPDDGCRVLVSRYRPRGLRREDECWDVWLPQLGPSKALHAAAYGKDGAPIAWEAYAERYLREMESQTFWIQALGERARQGETLTLLCSSACDDPARCHRTLLRGLLEAAAAPRPHEPAAAAGATGVIRRRPKP